MKTIDIGNKVIFVDTITGIECNECTDSYYIDTTHGDYRVKSNIYYKVKEYLLSLNEDTKDDTFEHLFNTLSGRCKKLIEYVDDLKDSKIISVEVAKHLKDILQSGF